MIEQQARGRGGGGEWEADGISHILRSVLDAARQELRYTPFWYRTVPGKRYQNYVLFQIEFLTALEPNLVNFGRRKLELPSL